MKSNDMEVLIRRNIEYLEECGLKVIALVSDMGPNNTGLWTRLGVVVQKNGIRRNSFSINGHDVFVLADVSHLLKSLRNALLNNDELYLPEEVAELENLPNNVVCGKYIQSLWQAEIRANKSIRTLHHLTSEDIFPSNYQKMHVGSAVRYFSDKTAAGIELAVEQKILPEEAKVTAWFVNLIHMWFELVSSRLSKTSITIKNQDKKLALLQRIITVFQGIRIGKKNVWKPLNRGFILSSLSLCDISKVLLKDDLLQFLLFHRFNTDALENINSQIRRRGGASPTVSACLNAVKIITISQLISQINKGNYENDSDIFLLDYFRHSHEPPSVNPVSKKLVNVVQTPDFSKPFDFIQIRNSSEPLKIDNFNTFDLNLISYICGSTMNSLFKKISICETCRTFFNTDLVSDKNLLFYIDKLNTGGLKVPNYSVINIIINCEIIFRKFVDFILHNNCKDLIEKLSSDFINAYSFPVCKCIQLSSIGSFEKFIVDHYFKIRSYSLISLNENRKRKQIMYGTSSAKKRKVTTSKIEK